MPGDPILGPIVEVVRGALPTEEIDGELSFDGFAMGTTRIWLAPRLPALI